MQERCVGSIVFEDLEVYQLTSIGDREVNQDCMAYSLNADYALFVVADGLGGHEAGEKASKYFCQGLFRQVQHYQKILQQSGRAYVGDIMHAWVEAAVDEMKELFSGSGEGEDAHTTCVILYLDKQRAVTAHCGDSRIYRLNELGMLWRTKDHSIVQGQLNEGAISEREMGLHPEQNQLLRTINIKKRHRVEVNIYPPIEKGETFILCTDGFWEFLKKSDLMQLANLKNSRGTLLKMAKMMNFRAHGRGDNLTVQWLRF